MISRGFVPILIPLAIVIGIVAVVITSPPATIVPEAPLNSQEKETTEVTNFPSDSILPETDLPYPIIEEQSETTTTVPAAESSTPTSPQESSVANSENTPTVNSAQPVFETQTALVVEPIMNTPPQVTRVPFTFDTQYVFEGLLVKESWPGFASVYTYTRDDDWFTLVFSNPNTSNNTPISSNPTTEEFVSKFEHASIQLNLTPFDSEWETKIQLAARTSAFYQNIGFTGPILANLSYQNGRLSGVVETTLTQTISYRKECLPLPQDGSAPPECFRVLSYEPTPVRIAFSLAYPNP
jgi:hypothetical protein